MLHRQACVAKPFKLLLAAYGRSNTQLITDPSLLFTTANLLIFPINIHRRKDFNYIFIQRIVSIGDFSISKRPSLIIGVTNPFFCKVLQHWPNIIKVADVSKQTVPPGNQNAIEEITNKALNSLNSSFNKSPTAKIKKTSSIRVVDNKPAVYTHYESYLSKNKEILKNLIRVNIKLKISF